MSRVTESMNGPRTHVVQSLNVMVLDLQLLSVLVDDVKRSTTSSGIGVDLDFLLKNKPNVPRITPRKLRLA